MKRDNVGNLVTGDGDQLTPVITIPSGALKIDIGQDGTVSVLLPGVTQASQVGQIQLVRFDNPSGLVAMGTIISRQLCLRSGASRDRRIFNRLRNTSTGILRKFQRQSGGRDGQHDHRPTELRN